MQLIHKVDVQFILAVKTRVYIHEYFVDSIIFFQILQY